MKYVNKELLEENIEKAARYDLDNNNIFGSSYAVIQSGKTVLKKHFGTADGNLSHKVNDESMFRLASMTKPITAVAMLILAERKLISLDDSVSKYFPEFENIHIVSEDGTDMGITKTKVKIIHLLTHTSGLGSIKNVEMTEYDRKNISNTIQCFVKAGLDFEPLTVQRYSPFAAFDVLAAIAEKVTGTDYGEFLKNEIFKPCGMKNTTFTPSLEQWERVVKMHSKTDNKSCEYKMCDGCVFENFPAKHKLAGAGLVSSLDDYVCFAKMLLNKGKTENHVIVSENTFEKMFKAYVPPNIMPGNQNWGLGVRVVTDTSYDTLPVGTFGWSGAYGSHFWIDTENDICAVFMKNSKFDGGSGNKSACRFEKAVHDSLID